MNETLRELENIRKSLGLNDYDAKARIPTIIDSKPVADPKPVKPRRKPPQRKPPVKKRKPIRQAVIKRGKVDRAAQAKLTRKPNSRINPKSTLTPREWLERNVWVGVESSNVRAIKYSKSRYELYVRFRDGSEYKYSGVDKLMARQMFDSTSKGKWVWRRLRRANRPYQRIK